MPATLLKRHSGTGAFLWILPNFQEHLRATASAYKIWGTKNQ